MPNPFARPLAPQARKSAIEAGFIQQGQAGRPVATDWSFDSAFVHGFRASSIVYTCVDRKATVGSQIPWYVAEKRGGKWERIDGHEYEQLLEYPMGSFRSRQFLIYLALCHLDLSGQTFLKKLRVGRSVRELWPLQPSRTSVIAAESGGWVAGYELRNGSQVQRLKTEDVIHALRPNPANPLVGMSPLQAIGTVIDMDTAQVKWNRSVVENSATPSGAFIDPNLTTDEQIQETQDWLDAYYTGPANARRPLVMGNGAQWLRMGLTPQELDWMESRKFSMGEMSQALGFLAAMFTQDAMTYENLRTSVDFMVDYGVLPMIALLQDAFNTSLLQESERRRLWIRPDLSEVESIKDRLTRRIESHQRAIASGIPVNTSAVLHNIPVPSVPGGDQPLISTTLTPLLPSLTDTL